MLLFEIGNDKMILTYKQGSEVEKEVKRMMDCEKNIRFVLSVFVLAALLSGCGRAQVSPGLSVSGVSVIGGAVSEGSVSGEAVSGEEEWRAGYTAFLDDLYKKSKTSDFKYSFCFYLRDIDNSGVPELIVGKNAHYTVYTFDGEVKKTGDIPYAGGTGRFFASDSEAYPGIFGFNVGGGYEHHWYIALEDNKLVCEDLWNEDYSGISEELGLDRERIEDLSSDEGLVRESKAVYEKKRDLECVELTPENIKKVI